MPASNQSQPNPETALWERRERVLDEFEAAWRDGKRPQIDAYLTNGQDRLPTLAELVQADLEFRIQVGEPARAEVTSPDIPSWRIESLRNKSIKYATPRSTHRIWEVAYPVPTYSMGHSIHAIAFRSDGRQVAVNGQWWEVVEGRGAPRLQRSLTRTEGDLTMFAATDQVWNSDVSSWRILEPLRIHKLAPERKQVEIPSHGRARQIALSSNGRWLAVGWEDWKRHDQGGASGTGKWRIEIWDLDAARMSGESPLRDYANGPLAFSPDGKWLVACGRNCALAWDVEPHAPKWDLPVSGENLEKMIFLSDGNNVALGTSDGSVVIVNAADGRALMKWKAHVGTVTALATPHNGVVLATGGVDRVIRLWSLPDSRELAFWEIGEAAVTALSFSPDGRFLITGSGQNGTLKLWDVPAMRRELAALGLDWQ